MKQKQFLMQMWKKISLEPDELEKNYVLGDLVLASLKKVTDDNSKNHTLVKSPKKREIKFLKKKTTSKGIFFIYPSIAEQAIMIY